MNRALIRDFLLGHILLSTAGIAAAVGSLVLPHTLISTSYFFLAATRRKAIHYRWFVASTFCILVLFLSFRFEGSVLPWAILKQFSSSSTPAVAYSFILVPFTYLGWSLNHMELVSSLNSAYWSRILLPVLLVLHKRELIKRRFASVTEALSYRGIPCLTPRHKFMAARRWQASSISLRKPRQ